MKLGNYLQSIFIPILVSTVVLAQETSISGKVIDLTTKQPVPMVNIYLRGRTLGTTTDTSGAFTLSLPSEENLIVSFSHVA